MPKKKKKKVIHEHTSSGKLGKKKKKSDGPALKIELGTMAAQMLTCWLLNSKEVDFDH